MYFLTNWGAKEPQNLTNHRVVVDFGCVCFPCLSGWGLLDFMWSCVPLRVFFVIRELLRKSSSYWLQIKLKRSVLLLFFWFLMYFSGRNRLVIKRNLPFFENADFSIISNHIPVIFWTFEDGVPTFPFGRICDPSLGFSPNHWAPSTAKYTREVWVCCCCHPGVEVQLYF